MKVLGIVAEFNPFHNGHFHLIEQAEAAGFSHCVCVMSGNFVQRGEPAVTEKRIRTKAALQNGADLIIEMPLAGAVAPARRFAKSAVSLLKATGCVDAIAFGSESGELAPLKNAAEMIASSGYSARMKELLSQGNTFAKARALAFEHEYGKAAAALLSAPNNVLAVEYLRAAEELGWSVEALTFPRKGAAHDSEATSEGIASASYLRRHAEDFDMLAGFAPASATELYREAAASGSWPLDFSMLESMAFSYLRRFDREALRTLPDLSEGIEDRLWKAIRAAKSYEEILMLTKTKRYTLARIRRLALCAFLGVCDEDTAMPPYLRVLGANKKGRELLGVMRKKATLPLESSLARLRDVSDDCRRAAELEASAADLYTAALPSPKPCGYDYTAQAVFVGKH